MIIVSFARNDPDNGHALRMVSAVHVHDEYGDSIVLEGKYYPEPSHAFSETGLPLGSPSRCDRGFKIDRHEFPCYGWMHWHGNWCWDATRMPAVSVLALLAALRHLEFRCTSSSVAFGDVWDAGKQFTPKVLEEALS